MRVALVALLAVALTGCGGQRTQGSATLWVTRDSGAGVLLSKRVPAGDNAMRTLDRVSKIETRYGGRYVQAIDGLAGSLAAGRDWFVYVNGILADRSATEVRLHPGDVEWWDFHSWRGGREVPVVVGAFPEPFLHGYGGHVRLAAVRYAPGLAARAKALGRELHAASVAPASVPVAAGANVLRLVGGPPRFTARLRHPGAPAGSPVEFTLSGDPARGRHRFEVATA